MSGRARATGRFRVLALAAVVLAVVTGALPAQSPSAQAAPLAAGSDFTISSAISSSATSSAEPALLYPGVTRYLWYTVSNPLREPITVTSLGVAHVDAPASCPTANLDLGDPTFSGALVVPARTSLTVPAPKPIALINLPDVNQDACKNVTFTFTFTGTGWYSDSSTPAAKLGTATLLATTPSLAVIGTPVTVTARVIPSPTPGTPTPGSPSGTASLSTGRPTGDVTFYLTTPSGTQVLLGTGPLGPDGSASLRLASLPPGSGRVHAVYSGTDTFAASTSPPAIVSIVTPPAQCTATYSNSMVGTPESPVITGTKGNDFIYAVGADYRIKAGRGDDCVVVGDGDNTISAGSGADVVIAGNGRNGITIYGSRNRVLIGDGNGNRVTVTGTSEGTKVRQTNSNVVTIGDGSANRVTVGKGSRNRVALGDGAGNRVTVHKGSGNVTTLGDGARNRITITGSKNHVTVGSGTANRIKVGTGTRNRITVGNGAKNSITTNGSRNKVILGKGKQNRVVVRTGTWARTTCSLPTPPRTWRGAPVRYYRDTLIRCQVVMR